MNIFEFQFRIEDKTYDVYVDSSKDEWKRIVINNQEVVHEKYTLFLNGKAYIIYYPIQIGEDLLVISIDDDKLVHKYNAYLNGRSLLDATELDENYLKASVLVEKGFSCFVKENILRILKKDALPIFGLGMMMAICLREFHLKILGLFLMIPVALLAFVLLEWFEHRYIVKNYKDCFRPTSCLK